MSKKGIFIVIEGLDGSGKTTQADLTWQKNSRKNTVFCLQLSQAEAKSARLSAKDASTKTKRLPTEAEALLFAADRIEHMQKEVKPALDEGKLVICDRYIYSSLAYQGSAGLSLDWIKTINARALQPDFSVFIDVDPETGSGAFAKEKICDGNYRNAKESPRSLPQVC